MLKNIKYTSLSVQKRLQVELKQYRAEALRVMVEQNEEVKNIEKENLFCCQKLSTVTKENQRYICTSFVYTDIGQPCIFV